MQRPFGSNYKRKNKTDGYELDYKTDGLYVIKDMLLMEALGHKTSLASLKGSISPTVGL